MRRKLFSLSLCLLLLCTSVAGSHCVLSKSITIGIDRSAQHKHARALSAAPVFQELIRNGNFETGTFDGWTVLEGTPEIVESARGNSALFAVSSAGPFDEKIGQDLSNLRLNHEMVFSFWLYPTKVGEIGGKYPYAAVSIVLRNVTSGSDLTVYYGWERNGYVTNSSDTLWIDLFWCATNAWNEISRSLQDDLRAAKADSSDLEGLRLASVNVRNHHSESSPGNFLVDDLSLTIVEPGTIMVPQDFSKIQQAIDAAFPNDIILVSAGIYHESLNIYKPLRLVGRSSSCIVDAEGTEYAICIATDDVMIDTFTIGNRSGLDCIKVENSANSTIINNIIGNSTYGISLNNSKNNLIVDNTILNTTWGSGIVFQKYSNDNFLIGNTISNNSFGITISTSCFNNSIYHNNFINNTEQIVGEVASTIWDNGAEGNYWSDYNGIDSNGDGIGDTSLPYRSADHFPLMEPWDTTKVFTVSWDERTYHVTINSNSTIASFNFIPPLKQIRFNATGAFETSGFCNITIPKELLWALPTEAWQVRIDEENTGVVAAENSTHTSLYLVYNHSTHRITIIGTHAIPEFPSFLSPLLFMTATLLIAMVYKRKYV